MGTNPTLIPTWWRARKCSWRKLSWRNAKQKTAVSMTCTVPCVCCSVASPCAPKRQQQSETPAQPQTNVPTGTQTTTLPPQSEPTPSSAPLRVMVGKSLLINTTERLKRISVTDPAVAFAQVITPTQILVHGKSPGEVSLLIWDELERSRSFDLRVDVDVSACAEEERRVFPDEQIDVTPSRAAIVLSGHVSTEDVAKRAGELATAYSPRVVNVLTFGPVGAQEVLLQVKFAEVDRTALTQLGVNFISNGAANTVGTITTGQFGGFGPQTLNPRQFGGRRDYAPARPSTTFSTFLFFVPTSTSAQ